jgi:hypothetical protein
MPRRALVQEDDDDDDDEYEVGDKRAQKTSAPPAKKQR